MATKILIVEDDGEMREILSRIIIQEGYEVSQAKDGGDIDESMLLSTGCVLLDINLPGESGFDVARRLRSISPTIGLIMLTGRGELTDRVLGLELGADDYIQKPFELRELIARLRAVLRRSRGHPGQAGCAPAAPAVEFDGWRIYGGSRKVLAPCGREVHLTTTEFEILRLLSEHRGQTVSRQKLYEAVRGKDWSPLDRTLDTHVANLRKKLDAAGGGSFIKAVHGQGYVLAVD